MRNTPETEMGGDERRFPMTSWSVLLRARDGEAPERRGAVERLVSLYWKPVYCLIRRTWGKSNEDAKDLTQEFFAEAVLDGGLIEKYVPERGRFRAYVKAAVQNFLRDVAKADGRRKRGGGAKVLSLDGAEFDAAAALPDRKNLTPDQEFEAEWKSRILARALALLEERLRAEGKTDYYEVFRRYDLEPAAAGTTYESVGTGLGLSTDAVKNRLTWARKEYRAVVLEVVCDTVQSDADLAREMESLFGA